MPSEDKKGPDDSVQPPGPSRLSIEIALYQGKVRPTVTHDRLVGEDELTRRARHCPSKGLRRGAPTLRGSSSPAGRAAPATMVPSPGLAQVSARQSGDWPR